MAALLDALQNKAGGVNLLGEILLQLRIIHRLCHLDIQAADSDASDPAVVHFHIPLAVLAGENHIRNNILYISAAETIDRDGVQRLDKQDTFFDLLYGDAKVFGNPLIMAVADSRDRRASRSET